MTNLLKLRTLFLAFWLLVIHSAVTPVAGAIGPVCWHAVESQIQGDGNPVLISHSQRVWRNLLC